MTHESNSPFSDQPEGIDWDAMLNGEQMADPNVDFWVEHDRREVLAATRNDIIASYVKFFNDGLDMNSYAARLAELSDIDTDNDRDFLPLLNAEIDRIIMSVSESQVGQLDTSTIDRIKITLAADVIRRYGSMSARPLIDMVDIANPSGITVGQLEAEAILEKEFAYTIDPEEVEDLFTGLDELLRAHASDECSDDEIEQLLCEADEIGARRNEMVAKLQLRHPDLDIVAHARALRMSIQDEDDPSVTDDEAMTFLHDHIDGIVASLDPKLFEHDRYEDTVAKEKITYAGKHYACYGDKAVYLNEMLDLANPAGVQVAAMSRDEIYAEYREHHGRDPRHQIVHEALQMGLNHDYLQEVIDLLDQQLGIHEQHREDALSIIAMATQLAVAKWEKRHLNEVSRTIRALQEQSVRLMIMHELARILPDGRGDATVKKKLFGIVKDAEEALDACPELIEATLDYDLAKLQIDSEQNEKLVLEYDVPACFDTAQYDRLMKSIADRLMRDYMQTLAERFGEHPGRYKKQACALIQNGIESALLNIETAHSPMTSEELKVEWQRLANVPNNLLNGMGMYGEYKRGESLLLLNTMIRRAHDDAAAYLYD